MASKSKRLKARKKRRNHTSGGQGKVATSDPHVEFVMQSTQDVQTLFSELSGHGDLTTNIERAFEERVEQVAGSASRFAPLRLAEAGRLAYFPLAPVGEVVPHPRGGAHQLELLLLLALTSSKTYPSAAELDESFAQPGMISEAVSEAQPLLEQITSLGWLRSLATADPNEPFGWLSFSVQGSEVAMRNSSYPDVSQATVLELFDRDPLVRAALETELGFTATDALKVLRACNDIQINHLNDRGQSLAASLPEGLVFPGDEIDEGSPREFRDALVEFMAVFEPAAQDCSVGVEDLVAETGVRADRVQRVVDFFTLDVSGIAPLEVAQKFVVGDNPWRRSPLLSDGQGRVMLLHDAHTALAIKERFEDCLKLTKAWNAYAKHRGELLEARVARAMLRILPGATYRDGVEFYIPATEAEEVAGEPTKYTKRVECDHLILVDDVAFVIEDKAVAFSALARDGKAARQLGDLRNIITKAAEQSGRVRTGIIRDGGLQVDGEGWVELSHIREIHSIAVSLDDIPTVFTATAELLEAGLVALDNVPWTVSLHDLELVADLIDRPAEFLLYLRRRRDPTTTMMFHAPDELDLFLYFFEAGLWVEPDPVLVREAFPFLPEPKPGDLRRFRHQVPVFITSRTDDLDRWHYTRDSPARAAKPTMASTRIVELVDELHRRESYAWLSIGATLLSGSATAQESFARHAKDLLSRPDPAGRGRSMAIPITGSVNRQEGWLLVWATKPPGIATDSWVAHIRDYLNAKGHQLGMSRMAAFAYDEATHDLIEVLYEANAGTLSATSTKSLQGLRPATDFQGLLPPAAKRRPRR